MICAWQEQLYGTREHMPVTNCPLSNIATFFCCNVQLEMTRTRIETVLNKLTKSEFLQLLLNTEDNMAAQISILTVEVKEPNNYFKKLEGDVMIVKNIKLRLVE